MYVYKRQKKQKNTFQNDIFALPVHQYRTIDPQLIKVLSQNQQRLNKMLNQTSNKTVVKSRADLKDINKSANTDSITIEQKLNRESLVLPRLRINKGGERSRYIQLKRNSSLLGSEKKRSKQTQRILQIYKSSRTPGIIGIKNNNSISNIKPKVAPRTKHILPSEGYKYNEQQQNSKQLHSILDVYHLELQKQMIRYIDIDKLLEEEREVKKLKNKFRYLESFDKQYFSKQNEQQLSLMVKIHKDL